jgi:outer membrane usher protein FimD/PapC
VKLAARDHIELQLTISLAVHTTRKPQPGKHSVDVMVNGSVFPAGTFEVTRAKKP